MGDPRKVGAVGNATEYFCLFQHMVLGCTVAGSSEYRELFVEAGIRGSDCGCVAGLPKEFPSNSPEKTIDL